MKLENDTKITEEALTLLGFKKKEGEVFENNQLPYWVKDGIVLFFNETDKENYLLGIGDRHMDKYFAITFYWVSTFSAVKKLYTLKTNGYLNF